MITPAPLSCLTISDLICLQIIPTDITHSGLRTTLSNMGVKLLSLDDEKMLPWRNELFLSTLQEKAYRQIVILAPELSTSIYVLSQTVLQLGYLTFIACDELQDIALHKILRLTQAGVILITPDELIAELSLTEIAHSEGE